MSIQSKRIQKSQLRGKYDKTITPELKFQILQELQYCNIKELSKKYGVARSTITYWQKPEEHIYNNFKIQVLKRLYQFVDMRLEGNLSLSEQAIQKDIKFIINYFEYFEYSEQNPIRRYIPETKINSKKQRIIKYVRDMSLSYFKQQKEQLSKGKIGGVVEIDIPQQQQQFIVQIQENSQQQNFSEFYYEQPIWFLDENSEVYFDSDCQMLIC